MARRTLIIGCGYLGLQLARELMARGEVVAGWVRSEKSAGEIAEAGIEEIIVGNVAEEVGWCGGQGEFDAVVHCASSGGGGVEVYRQVYLQGARMMNEHAAKARRILVSSTSVYGQTDGAWVDESSPTAPASETSRVLVEAERESLAAGAVVVRASGIYGPARAGLFEKFRRGEAVLEGNGTRWVNQVQRDDLAAAVVHLLESGKPGEVYNACDDEPVMLRDYYAWCAEKLGRPMPPAGERDPGRKRGVTNKRVANGKLRESGWALKYPTFREGLESILRSE